MMIWKDLVEFSKFRPITLILPSLFSELHGKALPSIISEISKVKYIRNIVIGLDRANEKEFKKAKSFFQNYHNSMKFYGMTVQI